MSKDDAVPYSDGIQDSGHFDAYSQHSAVLRTWLVAYGIGAPALILSQDRIWTELSSAGVLADVAAFFLLGVFLQVFLAAVNKSVMWACYYGDVNVAYKASSRYRFACWLSKQYAIDFAIDVAAMLAFAWATYLSFKALALATPS